MGYDVTRFQGEVDEDLLCPICSMVLEEPVQVNGLLYLLYRWTRSITRTYFVYPLFRQVVTVLNIDLSLISNNILIFPSSLFPSPLLFLLCLGPTL